MRGGDASAADVEVEPADDDEGLSAGAFLACDFLAGDFLAGDFLAGDEPEADFLEAAMGANLAFGLRRTTRGAHTYR